MIECNNLVKYYGKSQAVRDLSFKISKGSVVGLLGPNGAGKTTTMRMLTTFLRPSSGTAKVAGFDVVREADDVKRNIGYLPETPALYREMSVRDFLVFIAAIKDIPREQVAGAVSDTIERCLLKEVATKRIEHLSKGFRQRVGLAAAIIHSPSVIILDEPTSGLDPAQIIEIRNLIKNLAGKHTVLLSTHILPEVVETCSEVIIVARGRVVAQGAIAELTNGQTLERRFMEAVSTDV